MTTRPCNGALFPTIASVGDTFSPEGRTVDVVTQASAASHLVRAAAQRLQLFLRCHAIETEQRVGQAPDADVIIVESRGFEVGTGLLLADLRDLSPARLILITPDPFLEQRLAARLHGADHIVDAGADERELAAILRNELRHRLTARARIRAGEEDRRWRLDRERWALVAPNGSMIRLTHSEFQLLDMLIGQAGKVLSRPQLRGAIDGNPCHERVLDVVLSRLRRKVWDCAGLELPLRSARREGYVFAGIAAAALPPE